MPERRIVERARRDKRQGKSPRTQAGEFVREEIHKIRRGEHGARSTKQAIAIGLSEARRAGVDLPPPRRGQAKRRTRKSAKYAYEAGQHKRRPRRRPRVSRAVKNVLKHEPRSAASRHALSRQARGAERGGAPPRDGLRRERPRRPRDAPDAVLRLGRQPARGRGGIITWLEALSSKRERRPQGRRSVVAAIPP